LARVAVEVGVSVADVAVAHVAVAADVRGVGGAFEGALRRAFHRSIRGTVGAVEGEVHCADEDEEPVKENKAEEAAVDRHRKAESDSEEVPHSVCWTA